MGTMTIPSESVYATYALRTVERSVVKELSSAQDTLMERAGQAGAWHVQRLYPLARHVVVVVGPGNNGGDGLISARVLREAGLAVTLLAPRGAPATLAARAAVMAFGESLGGATLDALKTADVIVDALLGIGLNRDVEPDLAAVICAMNEATCPVLSLDVPSGLDADTGHVRGVAVRADHTLSFLGLKTGFYLCLGPAYTGQIVLASLDIPDAHWRDVPAGLARITPRAVQSLLPRRERMLHKTLAGRVLVVAGGPGMPGAARLTGEACLRAGAGRVVVATAAVHAPAISMGCPELIVMGITQPHEVLPLLAEADVIVMGPGLGRSVWATQLLSVLWTAPQPLIVDADALNALAVTGHRRSNWCLTPHAGEAARLLGCSARAIQEERLQSVNALVTRYGGVVVLKGPSTLIAAEELSVPMVCERGNPGMATAGMGDVLCGVIAAIAAQQALPAESLAQSAAVGVEVHARAADMAAGTLERGLIARDVIAHLRVCVNPAC